MKRVFAPGCALVLYKPDVARRLREYLDARHGPIGEHLTCCQHEPGLGAGTQVVNVCPGCDKRFRTPVRGGHDDLAMGDPGRLGGATIPGVYDPEEWHRLLDAYIDAH